MRVVIIPGIGETTLEEGCERDSAVAARRCPRRPPRPFRVLGPLLVAASVLSWIGWASPVAGAARGNPGNHVIPAVGAENEYANVIGQVGGRYVAVRAVTTNPNTDPHTFEASARAATMVSQARLVVQNGLGYDSYMGKLESASPNPRRTVIVAQHVLGLPRDTPNPHLWYSPRTMPAVAHAVAKALAKMDPSHAGYFARHARIFVRSLQPWFRAMSQLRARYPHHAVAVTEPVADYLLRACGLDIATPWGLQASTMNGIDPAPQAVAIQDRLLSGHHVQAFVYNRQVTDSTTKAFLGLARTSHVPVVGVYETMPGWASTYQSWMLDTVSALRQALSMSASKGSP